MARFDPEQISFIGGESAAWPAAGEAGTGDFWRQMHRAVGSVRTVVEKSCDQFGAIEDNRDLSVDGQSRQLNDVGLDVMRRVDEDMTLGGARKRAAERLAQLDAEMQAHTKPPEEPSDIALAGEIRAALRGMSPRERMDFIARNLDQPGLAGAVTSGAGFLSGLSATEQATVREMIAEKLYAPQIAEKATVTRALRELETGVERARTLLSKRARLARNHHGEWAPAPIHYPIGATPRGAFVPPTQPGVR
jgi:hypothetical protein